jgi:hypothetical protein
MKFRDNTGRRFSEDIERLFNGEEPPTNVSDSDYAETLRFARNLMALRQDPDPRFAADLKHRLAITMAAQDSVASEQQSWFSQVLSRPGLRLAMVSTFVVLAAVGVLWRAGLLSPAMPGAGEAPQDMLMAPPAPGTTDAGSPEMARAAGDATKQETNAAVPAAAPTSIVVVGYTEPTAALGESVTITITLRNEGPDGYTLTPFPPALAIRQLATGQVIFTFAPGTATHALSGMEFTQFDVTWDQRDIRGAQVEPGRYGIDVEMMDATTEKGDIAVPTASYNVAEFDILGGASAGTVRDSGTTQQE